MKLFLSLLFLVLPVQVFSQNIGTLKTFESDGCTMFVDGTPSKPGLWSHCCLEHDLRYWYGGELTDMDHSDLELKACVKAVAGDRWANLIYNGVRAGHSSPVKSKFAWSWGWEPLRKDEKLSSDESAYVKEEIRHLPLDPQFIEAFLKKYF